MSYDYRLLCYWKSHNNFHLVWHHENDDDNEFRLWEEYGQVDKIENTPNHFTIADLIRVNKAITLFNCGKDYHNGTNCNTCTSRFVCLTEINIDKLKKTIREHKASDHFDREKQKYAKK